MSGGRLVFDHCYTVDREHRFLARLANAGFTLDPKATEHPGRHTCRFIPFAPVDGLSRQFLEFISKPKDQSDKPGLSFAREGGPLHDHYAVIRRGSFLRPSFEHRNYEWKTRGRAPRRLGWNFVHFARKIPAAEIWLTEYERADGRASACEERPRHANGCLGIVGLHFEASAAGRRYFEAVLARPIQDRALLPHGVELTFEDSSATRFRYVVVRSRSLSRFRRVARPDALGAHRGRKAAFLRNPHGWDVCVV